MEFTRYFSGVIKHSGVPNIATSEYQKLFNIISLENRLDELYRLKEKERSADRRYGYEIRIMALKGKLERLTMKNKPENLLRFMLSNSGSDIY